MVSQKIKFDVEIGDDTAGKGSVIIIAEMESHVLYNAIRLEGERTKIVCRKDALEAIQNSSLDVILLDCGSDTICGLELLRKIKNLRVDTPVIFIAGESSMDVVADTLRTGAREFFIKPVDIFELKRVIRRFLDIKRASREKRIPFMTSVTAGNDLCVTSDKPSNLLRAASYIGDNLSEKITTEGLSRMANLSKYHFCRNFKKHFGTSPMKFVTLVKINKAKELLKREDLRVKEVASHTGFNNLGTFIRQFKKAEGLTPTSYKELRKKSSAK